MTATKGTDLGTLTIGAWTARPKTGTADIDPYSRATIVRNGELPIGTGDGVAFTTASDDSRNRWAGASDALFRGGRPPAGSGTLSLSAATGNLGATRLKRYGSPAR